MTWIAFDRETFSLLRDLCSSLRAEKYCVQIIRDTKTLLPRRCRNLAVKDGLCEKHHPNGIRRRLSRK